MKPFNPVLLVKHMFISLTCIRGTCWSRIALFLMFISFISHDRAWTIRQLSWHMKFGSLWFGLMLIFGLMLQWTKQSLVWQTHCLIRRRILIICLECWSRLESVALIPSLGSSLSMKVWTQLQTARLSNVRSFRQLSLVVCPKIKISNMGLMMMTFSHTSLLTLVLDSRVMGLRCLHLHYHFSIHL